MRRLPYLFLIPAIFSFSCIQKKDRSAATIASPGPSDRKICIDNIGWLAFSKSYSFLMSPGLSEKEKDKMMEETDKGNPGYDYKSDDSLLKKQFSRFEFIRDNELLLENFKYSNNPDTAIITPAGKQIKISFARDTLTNQNDKIVVYFDKSSAWARMYAYMELKYALLDIIPGGNKEIVVLNEGHVSNNDLYDFFVYEIETNE